jgi:hypothetical protein
VRLDHLLSKESVTALPSHSWFDCLSIQRTTQLCCASLTPSWCTGCTSVRSADRDCSRPSVTYGSGPSAVPFSRCAASVASGRRSTLENCIASTSIFVVSSYKEPTVDALASTTDEGRGWLRKATGSCRPSFDPWISEWGNPAPVMGCHSGLNT